VQMSCKLQNMNAAERVRWQSRKTPIKDGPDGLEGSCVRMRKSRSCRRESAVNTKEISANMGKQEVSGSLNMHTRL
jgi:hypothetical protein